MKRLPNYFQKLIDLVDQNPNLTAPGTVTHSVIAHDDWCAIFHGGACNCDPDITLVPEDIQ